MTRTGARALVHHARGARRSSATAVEAGCESRHGRRAPSEGAQEGTLTMTIFVEIRAAEGGADAKLLVAEHLKVYARLVERA